MNKSISVVVPALIKDDAHFNMTAKCISLARSCTELPFELIVVESGTNYFEDVADVHINDHISTAEKSHNRGFKVASGDYITLLTNDVMVKKNWLECMVVCYTNIKDCGMATLATTQLQHQQEDRIEEGLWCPTFMTTRKIFDTIGYYDERFKNSWCDTDWLVRAYMEGWKMYRNFNCVVDHDPGQTNYNKQGFTEEYEFGRQLFMEKHKDKQDTWIYKVLTQGVVI